jgi:hypothetical protein
MQPYFNRFLGCRHKYEEVTNRDRCRKNVWRESYHTPFGACWESRKRGHRSQLWKRAKPVPALVLHFGITVTYGRGTKAERHKGTKAQRKPASNDSLMPASLCLRAFVPLCPQDTCPYWRKCVLSKARMPKAVGFAPGKVQVQSSFYS